MGLIFGCLLVLGGCLWGIQYLNNENSYKLVEKVILPQHLKRLREECVGWQLNDYVNDEEGNKYILINCDVETETIYLAPRENKNTRKAFSYKEYIARGMNNTDFSERQERLKLQLEQKAINERLKIIPPLPEQVSMSRNLLAMGTRDLTVEQMEAYNIVYEKAVQEEAGREYERKDLSDGLNRIQDAYETLGFDRDAVASTNQIKKAFHKLCTKYHPDACDDDKRDEYTKKFTQINEAYNILSNVI